MSAAETGMLIGNTAMIPTTMQITRAREITLFFALFFIFVSF